MDKYNAKKISDKLKADINKGEANKILLRVKAQFPEFKNYTVKYDATTNKFTFPGLSENQVRQIEHNLK
jgi:hypothetical protein